MANSQGINVGDVVQVSIALTPQAAQQRNFGVPIFIGDSDVIDVQTRLRPYTDLDDIAADYGSTAPEYLAAKDFFDQDPQPQLCYLGRWARTATSGIAIGGDLSTTQQSITNFTGVSNGGMQLSVDGSLQALAGLNFTGVSNLNAVAAIITTALAGAATCTWDANNGWFSIESASSGPTSSVSLATPPVSGTDISTLLGLTAAAGAFSVSGIAAETPLACVTILRGLTSVWYVAQFAASVQPQDSDYTAVSAFLEGAAITSLHLVSTQEVNCLNPNNSADIMSQMQALGFKRTFTQYSSTDPYVTAAAFGLVATVNFAGLNTLYTLKFQSETGVQPETLTEQQAAAVCGVQGVGGKNGNVFVNYNNDTAILQEGKMASGDFFDVVHGTDWLQNALQTAGYNALITARTKIPDTDGGVTDIIGELTKVLDQAVANGLVAPGVWLGPNVGSIVNGQTLPTGYYIFAPPVSSQSVADRQARKCPPITVCAKLAGAIHFIGVTGNISV